MISLRDFLLGLACVNCVMFATIMPASADSNSVVAWSRFRGPNGTGIPPVETDAPIEFGPAQHLRWKAELPSGHSSPCIWADNIFLSAHDSEWANLETLCLDRKTGRIKWRQSIEFDKLERINRNLSQNSPTSPTPTTDGERVFVYVGSFGLVAYDFDGTELWTKRLPVPRVPMHGTGSSPVIHDGRLIIDLHATAEPGLLCLRSSDGETLWKATTPPGRRGWSTPIVWQEEEETMVGLLAPSRFTAYNIADGSEQWWISKLPNETCASPIVHEKMLIFYCTHALGNLEELLPLPPFDELLAKYDANGDGKIGTDELPESLVAINREFTGEGLKVGNFAWKRVLRFGGRRRGGPVVFDQSGLDTKVKEVTAMLQGVGTPPGMWAYRIGGTGDVTESHLVWSERKQIPQMPTPLIYRDHLYLVRNGGVVICRDPRTGKILYRKRLGGAGGYYASPIASSGKIYIASDRGQVAVIEAGNSGTLLAKNDLEEPIVATPAIADGILYVRTRGHLYAFGD